MRTKIRRGIIPCEKPGRPPAIDEESVAKIRRRIGKNSEITYDEAVELLQQFYAENFKHRYPKKYDKLVASRKRFRMPKNTQKRYLRSLFPNLVDSRVVSNSLLSLGELEAIDRFDLVMMSYVIKTYK